MDASPPSCSNPGPLKDRLVPLSSVFNDEEEEDQRSQEEKDIELALR